MSILGSTILTAPITSYSYIDKSLMISSSMILLPFRKICREAGIKYEKMTMKPIYYVNVEPELLKNYSRICVNIKVLGFTEGPCHYPLFDFDILFDQSSLIY